MSFKQNRFALLIILFVGGFFRVWNLGSNPPALFRDEAEKGYSAWTIGRMGGYFYFAGFAGQPSIRFQRFPVFINVMGVWTSATYQYCAAPFTALGGLNEWTIRLPAALAGTATILMLYLLVFAWTGSASAALFSAGFLAVSPWHIIFSRWAAQGIFVPLCIATALFFFQIGINHKPRHLILSALFFAIAFYTYEVARIFVPLILLSLFIIFRKEFWAQKKWSGIAAFVFLGIAVPIFIHYITGGRSARFSRISIFGDGKALTESLFLFIKNYLKHYRFDFLFVNGDREMRHGLPGWGLLYLWEAPLLLYGFYILLKKKTKYRAIICCWLFFFPVAASLTNEGVPHALRSITGLPLFQIINGIAAASLLRRGIDFMAQNKRYANISLILIILIFAVVCLNVLRMGRHLFHVYPYESASSWQYGVKQAMEMARQHGVKPENIYLSGYIAYAPYLVMVYNKIEPIKLREEGFSGLGYKFLPPNFQIGRLWENLPAGSWLILYPFEQRDIKSDIIIPFPSPRGRLIPAQSALEILIKKDESS
ncbi:MAG TPA: glycosyltransferase family 39 protein [Candidatus Sumerlaeia bacterium]|nr:glycosyltransferase family 39 protein [Candidatus Sumerlaeia bacterium]